MTDDFIISTKRENDKLYDMRCPKCGNIIKVRHDEKMVPCRHCRYIINLYDDKREPHVMRRGETIGWQ